MESFSEQEFLLLIALGVAIMSILGISLVFFYNKTRKKLLMEALKGQQLLLEKTILTQEAERKRIAKDLHDEVGAKLNLVHLYAQQLRRQLSDNLSVQSTVRDITNIVNSAIDTTRQISHGLLPPILEEFGLEQALIELAENFSKPDSLSIQLDVAAKKFPIATPLIELNIFRIIQELVSNSIKHGEVKHISIRLSADQNLIHLIYQDDGKGFALSTLKEVRGLGLKNIESRLKMIHGKVNYNSSLGNGFQANIQITLNL